MSYEVISVDFDFAYFEYYNPKSFAQLSSGNLKGRIVTIKDEAVSGATVQLHHTNHSALNN